MTTPPTDKITDEVDQRELEALRRIANLALAAIRARGRGSGLFGARRYHERMNELDAALTAYFDGNAA